jgi:predicted transcriptional regulator
MESPFPTVEAGQAVDTIVKVLSKANPAVLVRDNGVIRGIVTRSDMLAFLMAR